MTDPKILPPTPNQQPQTFGFTTDQSGNESRPETPIPKQPKQNPFAPASKEKKKKRFSKKILLLVATTVLVGVSVPLTVFLIKGRQDIRSRAFEESVTITPPPYPIFEPTAAPQISGCSQSCSAHADCVAGFFCDSGACKNALCPTSIDCQCESQ